MQKEGEAGGGHGNLGIKLQVHDISMGGGGLVAFFPPLFLGENMFLGKHFLCENMSF